MNRNSVLHTTVHGYCTKLRQRAFFTFLSLKHKSEVQKNVMLWFNLSQGTLYIVLKRAEVVTHSGETWAWPDTLFSCSRGWMSYVKQVSSLFRLILILHFHELKPVTAWRTDTVRLQSNYVIFWTWMVHSFFINTHTVTRNKRIIDPLFS